MGMNIEYFQRTLGAWANQMCMRFGPTTRVYLVGSTTLPDAEDPRDLDVTIVLSNDAFRARYGLDKNEFWSWNYHIWPWTEKMRRYGREVAKIGAGLQPFVPGWPVDVKVYSDDSQDRHHGGKARVRLDTIGPPERAATEEGEA